MCYKEPSSCNDLVAWGRDRSTSSNRNGVFKTHTYTSTYGSPDCSRTFYHSGPTWCPQRLRLAGRPWAQALFFTHGPLDYSCAICSLTLLFCLPSIHNTDPSQLPAICCFFFSSFLPTGIKTKEAPFSQFQALISQSCRMRDQCAGRQMDAARGQEKELELRVRHKRGWGVLA